MMCNIERRILYNHISTKIMNLPKVFGRYYACLLFSEVTWSAMCLFSNLVQKCDEIQIERAVESDP